MQNLCVAAGCGNMPGDSVSPSHFPKDPNLCGVWTRQVQRTRRTGTVEAFLDHNISVVCFDEMPVGLQRVHFTRICRA